MNDLINFKAGEGNVIELDLTERDFRGRPCEEENVKIFKGFSGRKYIKILSLVQIIIARPNLDLLLSMPMRVEHIRFDYDTEVNQFLSRMHH